MKALHSVKIDCDIQTSLHLLQNFHFTLSFVRKSVAESTRLLQSCILVNRWLSKISVFNKVGINTPQKTCSYKTSEAKINASVFQNKRIFDETKLSFNISIN